MDFSLDEDQSLLKDSVARFVEAEYPMDKRKKLVTEGGGFSEAHWNTFAEMGWLMASVPEEFGGLGLGAVENGIIMEEFGRGLVVEPFLAVAILAARTLAASSPTGAAAEILSEIGTGAARPVLAHGEAGAFGEVAWVETRAEKSGNGWKLDGRKTLVVGGPFATHFLVSARISGGPGDEDGLGLFLVTPDAAGLERIDLRLADSSRASELVLNGVEVTADDLVGEAGGAFKAISKGYAYATAAICAEAVGAMDRSIWTTRDYLKVREQFGQPIGNFQALQHRMADMLIELELSRSQVFRALAYVESEPAIRDRAISSAKVQIGRSVKFVGGQSIQLHGGIGVTEEYSIGHYFKRLTMIDNAFGTVGVHLDRMARLERRAA